MWSADQSANIHGSVFIHPKYRQGLHENDIVSIFNQTSTGSKYPLIQQYLILKINARARVTSVPLTMNVLKRGVQIILKTSTAVNTNKNVISTFKTTCKLESYLDGMDT